MLGGGLSDPFGVEGEAQGLGLLPFANQISTQKRYRRASHTLAPLTGFWAPLSGATFEAYEIRHGQTLPRDRADRKRGVSLGASFQPVLADIAAGNTARHSPSISRHAREPRHAVAVRAADPDTGRHSERARRLHRRPLRPAR